jgi:copper chaperone
VSVPPGRLLSGRTTVPDAIHGVLINRSRSPMDFTTTFGVTGMTCGHCVRSVKGELGKLDGVTDVAVDFKSGTVNVTSSNELDRDAIEAAVDEAGYQYVG